VTFEGVEYERDRGGFYRCPWPCTDLAYSPLGRKFKGEDRFLLHLEVCAAKPKPVPVYAAPKPTERKIEGECSDCADPLWTLDPIWQMVDRYVCWDCRKRYLEAGVGYLDSIGLELPGEYS
jgi:hypothetical protein